MRAGAFTPSSVTSGAIVQVESTLEFRASAPGPSRPVLSVYLPCKCTEFQATGGVCRRPVASYPRPSRPFRRPVRSSEPEAARRRQTFLSRLFRYLSIPEDSLRSPADPRATGSRMDLFPRISFDGLDRSRNRAIRPPVARVVPQGGIIKRGLASADTARSKEGQEQDSMEHGLFSVEGTLPVYHAVVGQWEINFANPKTPVEFLPADS